MCFCALRAITKGFFLLIKFSIASECAKEPGPGQMTRTSLPLIKLYGLQLPLVFPSYNFLPTSIRFILKFFPSCLLRLSIAESISKGSSFSSLNIL